MGKIAKIISTGLIMVLVLLAAVPAEAFELTVDPAKESYSGGEEVTVSTAVYGETTGFSWFLTDWLGNTTTLEGEENSITFALPENGTDTLRETVVEAVYGSAAGSVSLNIDPGAGEAGELAVVELFPAPGATGAAADTEVFIRFNKPAELASSMPFIPANIYIGGGGYLLTPHGDGSKWSLAPGTLNLEPGEEYAVEIPAFITIREPGGGPALASLPRWSFDTGPAVANSIRVDNVRANIAQGAHLQLAAQVLSVTGQVMADRVTWSSATPGIAEVSPEGLVTGVADGLAEITVKAESNGEVAKTLTVGVGAETAPLQVLNLCPAPGESAQALVNTEVFIRFNKPAELASSMPFVPANIYIGGDGYLLTPHGDGSKWSLAPGTLNLEPGEEYQVEIPAFITIREPGGGPALASLPQWSFATVDKGAVVPAEIEITAYPGRLKVGESYPLAAVVRDKKGNEIADCPVEWEVVSISGGQAVVDGTGNLTGTRAGILELSARPEGYPGVPCKKIRVEIRADFDRHLLALWAAELGDEKERYLAGPLVGADGTIYLQSRKDQKNIIRAYDGNGEKIPDFQEISGFTSRAVLAEIGGREYLLAPRERKMCAFDARTGRLEWESAELTYDLGWAHVDRAGNIYAGCSGDGKIYAFGLDRERYLWSYYTGIVSEGNEESRITPLSSEGVYVIGGQNKVFCLDSQGELQWQYEADPLGEIVAAGVEVDSAGKLYFLEEFSASAIDGEKDFKVYALDSAGEELWAVSYPQCELKDLFIDADDSLYVTVNNLVTGTEKLARLSRADGREVKEFPYYGCDRFMRPGDGYIYTGKYIFNDNLEAVGYTGELEGVGYSDDFYASLSYMQYSPLALAPDGTLVRVLISQGTVAALEKVALYDTSGSVPAAITVEKEELVLYQGGKKEIFAQVQDGAGRLIPYLPLEYAVTDQVPVEEGRVVAEVDPDLPNRITAQNPGTARVRITVPGYPEITKTLSLEVRSPGEIQELYFVRHSARAANVKVEEKLTSTWGVVGEEQGVQLIVADANGELIPDLHITWSLEDSTLVQMYNYSGGVLGSVSKSVAVLNGLEPGTTTLTAALTDFPQVEPAHIEVEVRDAPYEILWTMALEGGWDDKIAYHTQNDQGTLFIANLRKLKAVSSGGSLVWEKDIGDAYGFEPGTPAADEDRVYVYDSSGFMQELAALSQADGSGQWVFRGGRGAIVDVRAACGRVYLLTEAGEVYGLAADSGRELWEEPLLLGTAQAALALTSEGELFCSAGNKVYGVSSAGETAVLYSGPAGAGLTLKGVTRSGSLILEKEQNGAYSLLALAGSGEARWEVPVAAPVEVTWGQGLVYAVTRQNVNPSYYFIDEGQGELRVAEVITAPEVETPYKYQACYRPLLGSDGILYLSLTRLYAVDAAVGELLWQGEFKDGFFRRIARTATLGPDNIVYLACDDAGFIAVRSKVAGSGDGSGFYLEVTEPDSLVGDSYRELVLRLGNELEEDREFRLAVVLAETEGAVSPGYSATADTLAAGEEKTYRFGLRIPRSGSYRVRIQVLDRENQLITEKTLPVR